MQIFVSVPTGRTITIQCEKEDSVSTLRTKIEAREGIAADLQRLVFAGHQLEDDQTLSDCNVGKDDTVIAVLRLLGGRGHGLVETTFDLEQLQDSSHCCTAGAAAGGSPTVRPQDDTSGRFLDSQSDDIFAELNIEQPSSLFSLGSLGGLPSFNRSISEQWYQNDTSFWANDVDSPDSAEEDSDEASDATTTNTLSPQEDEEMKVEPMEEPTPAPAPAPAPATSTRRAAKAVVVAAAAVTPNPKLIQKSHKGLSYNLDEVDDKLRKRLLKNRQSAERSRQRKNAERKSLEEQLQKKTDENAALQQELERMRQLLQQHGISY